MNLALGVSEQLRDVAESLGVLEPEEFLAVANGPEISFPAKPRLHCGLTESRGIGLVWTHFGPLGLRAVDPRLSRTDTAVELQRLVEFLKRPIALARRRQGAAPLAQGRALGPSYGVPTDYPQRIGEMMIGVVESLLCRGDGC